MMIEMDCVPDPAKPDLPFFDDFEPAPAPPDLDPTENRQPAPAPPDLDPTENRQSCKIHALSRSHVKRLQKQQQIQDQLEAFLRRYHFVDPVTPRRASVFAKELYPIHVAARIGDVCLLRSLLASGADPEQVNSSGQRALDIARRNNRGASHQEAMELLESNLKIVTMRDFFAMMKTQGPNGH